MAPLPANGVGLVRLSDAVGFTAAEFYAVFIEGRIVSQFGTFKEASDFWRSGHREKAA